MSQGSTVRPCHDTDFKVPCSRCGTLRAAHRHAACAVCLTTSCRFIYSPRTEICRCGKLYFCGFALASKLGTCLISLAICLPVHHVYCCLSQLPSLLLVLTPRSATHLEFCSRKRCGLCGSGWLKRSAAWLCHGGQARHCLRRHEQLHTWLANFDVPLGCSRLLLPSLLCCHPVWRCSWRWTRSCCSRCVSFSVYRLYMPTDSNQSSPPYTTCSVRWGAASADLLLQSWAVVPPDSILVQVLPLLRSATNDISRAVGLAEQVVAALPASWRGKGLPEGAAPLAAFLQDLQRRAQGKNVDSATSQRLGLLCSTLG